MPDVKLFCTDLLLVLVSTQLYQLAPIKPPPSSRSGDAHPAMRPPAAAPPAEDDPFLDYLFLAAEAQLRQAMRSGPAAAYGSAFSESLAVLLVRGLFTTGLAVGEPHREKPAHGSVLPAIRALLAEAAVAVGDSDGEGGQTPGGLIIAPSSSLWGTCSVYWGPPPHLTSSLATLRPGLRAAGGCGEVVGRTLFGCTGAGKWQRPATPISCGS